MISAIVSMLAVDRHLVCVFGMDLVRAQLPRVSRITSVDSRCMVEREDDVWRMSDMQL